MRYKHPLAAGVACCLLLAGTSSLASASLDSVSMTATSNVVGQPNSLSITFTAPSSFGAGGFIDLKPPAGFTVIDPNTDCNARITVTVSGSPAAIMGCGGATGSPGAVYTRMQAPIPAGATVQITYAASVITNSATPGAHTFGFETTSGSVLSSDSLPLTLVLPTPVPTLSEWAMIALGTVWPGLRP